MLFVQQYCKGRWNLQQERIISVLIGLVGACNSNSKTENTDCVVITALTYPSCELSAEELIEKIRAEKDRSVLVAIG